MDDILVGVTSADETWVALLYSSVTTGLEGAVVEFEVEHDWPIKETRHCEKCKNLRQ